MANGYIFRFLLKQIWAGTLVLLVSGVYKYSLDIAIQSHLGQRKVHVHMMLYFSFFSVGFFVFSSTKCQLFNICFMLTNISSLGVVISVFHAVLV